MSVTASTLTELDSLAKDLYSNFYQPQMAKGTPLKAQLDQLENMTFAGKKIIFGMKLETGGGASNAGARSTLPGNADGTYDQGETTPVRTYVRMAIDLYTLEVTKQQKGSYKPALEEKMEDRVKALQKEINRQMFSGGDGKLALTATGAASATQTLSSDYGVTNGGNPIRHVYTGDTLAFYDNAGALIARKTVSSKSGTLGSATGTVTLDSSVTSVSSGWVAKSTSDTDNYAQGEAKGLLAGMVQSSTFQGVTIGSTYSAVSLSNSGTLRDISDGLIGTLFNSIHAQCDEYPNLVVTRPGIVQKYSEIFLPIRRIDGQDVRLKGGYKPVAVVQHAAGEAPIIADNDCPGARLFALNTNYLRSIDLVGEDWAAFDGAQFSRITDQDGAEGYLRRYWQIAWLRLNCHGVLADLNDVSTVDRLYS